MCLAVPGKILSTEDRPGSRVTRSWALMLICGGQTHTIMRYPLDELLSPRPFLAVMRPAFSFSLSAAAC